MTNDFLLGCTYNIIPYGVSVPPLRRFELVREAGIFDYISWLPQEGDLRACLAAADRTGIPMTTGSYTHILGRNDDMMVESVNNAARVGMRLLNVMLRAIAADGHELRDDEILECYERMTEAGDRVGVTVSFEVHVDCWSEKFTRVTQIARSARSRGLRFRLTLDYSHVLFKIENAKEQDVSGIRADVDSGRVVLDPFEPGSLCEEWLSLDLIEFAQFRSVAPNNPPNVWGRNDDGSVPRGIMYPMVKPRPGEWHSPWHAHKLEACKEAFRMVLRHHLTRPTSPLRYVITEMIHQADHGMNAKFSLIDQNAACAHWIRRSWDQLKAMYAAGIPLTV